MTVCEWDVWIDHTTLSLPAFVPFLGIWWFLLHSVALVALHNVIFPHRCSNNWFSPTSRIDAFKLWCWKRLLRVPWTARRSNQSSLNKINPEYSLEGLMLKMKLQYFGNLKWRPNSLEKTLMLGKMESKRGSGQQRMRWLDSIPNSMDMNNKVQEIVEDRWAWCVAVHGVTKSWTWLSNWITISFLNSVYYSALDK